MTSAQVKSTSSCCDNARLEPQSAVVQVHLLEPAVPSLEFALSEAAEPWQHGNASSRRKAMTAFSKQKWVAPDQSMCAVLNWLLLTDPTSIAVGPDSDGLLNFCDSTSSSSSLVTSGPSSGSEAASEAASEAVAKAVGSSAAGELSLLLVPRSDWSFVPARHVLSAHVRMGLCECFHIVGNGYPRSKGSV